MKLILTSYFDKKLGIYSNPIFIPESTDEVIIEQTRRMCANPNIPKVMFEYDLYRLGSFDDKVGSFEIEERPVFLVSLGDFAHLAANKESEVVDHVS